MTLPESYPQKQYANKKAKFNCTILSVKEPTETIIDDKFAKNLGAKVTSFDFDNDAVDCAKLLKEKYYKNDLEWKITQGSVLDKNFLIDKIKS